MKVSRTIRFSVVAALFAISASAQAGYITGNAGFIGSVQITGGSDLSNATGLTFNVPQHSSFNSSENTGSFAGLNGQLISVASITSFAPLASAPFSFYTVGGITVTLESYIAGTLTQTINNLGVSYNAVLSEAGFTDTAGLVNFGVSTTDGLLFTNSGTVSASTPLPAAIFFVAPALGGLFGWSRRKSNASSVA